ncbi:prolyl oligopeptidase family serine peptidase [candidate division KSB1 bacterium]
MKKSTVLLIIVLLLSQPLLAQKRAITHDDLYSFIRLSDPQLSPDGELIAFVRTVYNKPENSSNSDIWLIPASGGDPRRLTASPFSDHTPRWSPNGSRIAFISSRGGSSQIYFIPVNGGEARKISNISTGASGVIWSPDGKNLAFTSTVYPELEGDEANRKKMEEQANSKVQAKLLTRLLYRQWNSWTNDTRNHVFVISADGGEAKDVTPGNYDTPPLDLGGNQDYIFSPDGSEICYVKNTDPMVATSTNNDIFIVNISSGNTTKITGNPANDNYPQYSPDGKYIAYRAHARAGFEADKYSLMLYERSTGNIIPLTEDYDRSAGQYLWSPDSKKIFFTAGDLGYNAIFSVDIATKNVEKITDKTYNSSLQIAPDGRSLIFLRQSMTMPAELFKSGIDGRNPVQLTHTNDGLLSLIEMNPPEEFRYKGAKGDMVHGFIVKPPFFDPNRKYPMIYIVHGGPQGAWSNNFHYRWNIQMWAAPGYVAVMVNPRGSTGYGQKFTDDITGDWGGKVYEDLMKGVDYVIENFDYVDEDRIAASGASYGGYMMNWFEGHTDRFKCLINHDGLFNMTSFYYHTEEVWFPEWEMKGTPYSNEKMYEKWSPHNYVKNFKTPMLIIHSELDYRVPLSEGLQVFTALQKMGVPSKLLYFPDEGHFISRPLNSELWHKTIYEWLAEYLK